MGAARREAAQRDPREGRREQPQGLLGQMMVCVLRAFPLYSSPWSRQQGSAEWRLWVNCFCCLQFCLFIREKHSFVAALPQHGKLLICAAEADDMHSFRMQLYFVGHHAPSFANQYPCAGLAGRLG